MDKAKAKSIFNGAIKLAIAAAIIAWLVQSGKFDLKVVAQLFQSPAFFFTGLLLMGCNLFVISERWRYIAAPQDVQASRWSVFRLTLIGTFFNYAMPGGVGGDVVKAFYFSKEHPHARATAITSVVLDRVLGLYAMMIMAILAMSWDSEHVLSIPTLQTLYIFLWALFLAMSLGLSFLFSKRLYGLGWIQSLLNRLPMAEKLNKLYLMCHTLGHQKSRLLAIFGISLLAQVFAIVFLWLAGRTAGFEVPIGVFFIVAPMGYMATAIPISPAGVGVGQAAFMFLFNAYLGHDSAVGPVVITAQQAMTAVFGLIGAILYVRHRDPHAQLSAVNQ